MSKTRTIISNSLLTRMALALTVCGAAALRADVIQLTGTMYSLSDSGPAVSNPRLNFVAAGDPFVLTIAQNGEFEPTITYQLEGISSLFRIPAADATETDFKNVTLDTVRKLVPSDFGSVAIDIFRISLCVSSAISCTGPNADTLTLNFAIPEARFFARGVPTEPVGDLPRLFLSEDAGGLQLYGEVLSYSYIPLNSSVVPEPASVALLAPCIGLLWLAARVRGARR